MDRGIKIAILCACLLSLGLGIIWDSVIDVVRPERGAKTDKLKMAPDQISATIGEANDQAAQPKVINPAPVNVEAGDSDEVVRIETIKESVELSADGEWPAHIAPHIKKGKYIMQDGDNFSRLANRKSRFLFLKEAKGINWMDWRDANSDLDPARIRAGTPVNIPSK